VSDYGGLSSYQEHHQMTLSIGGGAEEIFVQKINLILVAFWVIHSLFVHIDMT